MKDTAPKNVVDIRYAIAIKLDTDMRYIVAIKPDAIMCFDAAMISSDDEMC